MRRDIAAFFQEAGLLPHSVVPSAVTKHVVMSWFDVAPAFLYAAAGVSHRQGLDCIVDVRSAPDHDAATSTPPVQPGPPKGRSDDDLDSPPAASDAADDSGNADSTTEAGPTKKSETKGGIMDPEDDEPTALDRFWQRYNTDATVTSNDVERGTVPALLRSQPFIQQLRVELEAASDLTTEVVELLRHPTTTNFLVSVGFKEILEVIRPIGLAVVHRPCLSHEEMVAAFDALDASRLEQLRLYDFWPESDELIDALRRVVERAPFLKSIEVPSDSAGPYATLIPPAVLQVDDRHAWPEEIRSLPKCAALSISAHASLPAAPAPAEPNACDEAAHDSGAKGELQVTQPTTTDELRGTTATVSNVEVGVGAVDAAESAVQTECPILPALKTLVIGSAEAGAVPRDEEPMRAPAVLPENNTDESTPTTLAPDAAPCPARRFMSASAVPRRSFLRGVLAKSLPQLDALVLVDVRPALAGAVMSSIQSQCPDHDHRSAWNPAAVIGRRRPLHSLDLRFALASAMQEENDGFHDETFQQLMPLVLNTTALSMHLGLQMSFHTPLLSALSVDVLPPQFPLLVAAVFNAIDAETAVEIMRRSPCLLEMSWQQCTYPERHGDGLFAEILSARGEHGSWFPCTLRALKAPAPVDPSLLARALRLPVLSTVMRLELLGPNTLVLPLIKGTANFGDLDVCASSSDGCKKRPREAPHTADAAEQSACGEDDESEEQRPATSPIESDHCAGDFRALFRRRFATFEAVFPPTLRKLSFYTTAHSFSVEDRLVPPPPATLQALLAALPDLMVLVFADQFLQRAAWEEVWSRTDGPQRLTVLEV